MVEDLIKAVMHESDTYGAHEDALAPEHTYHAHDFECQGGQRGIQRDDVERQPVVEEFHGEHVVREDEPDVIGHAE